MNFLDKTPSKRQGTNYFYFCDVGWTDKQHYPVTSQRQTCGLSSWTLALILAKDLLPQRPVVYSMMAPNALLQYKQRAYLLL